VNYEQIDWLSLKCANTSDIGAYNSKTTIENEKMSNKNDLNSKLKLAMSAFLIKKGDIK
jgi:hypothetical protein